MRRLRYSVPYIAGKNLPKDSDPAPRGAGQSCGTGRPNWPNFNPPAPCGAGRIPDSNRGPSRDFNPPAPCGAGPPSGGASWHFLRFQSTRPLRGGTGLLQDIPPDHVISIHPPLAGRDGREKAAGTGETISIHPPLAGRDVRVIAGFRAISISIHPPRAVIDDARNISIHPPLAGRDCDPGAAHGDNDDFNPPAPCGAGLSRSTRPRRLEHFNPPAPCGAGLLGSAAGEILEEFQSTRPLRGGTVLSPRYVYLMAISIHPPLAGRDQSLNGRHMTY